MTKRRERGGCLGRMVGVAIAALLVAVPVALGLPAALVTRVLEQVYPGGAWDLSDPLLVDTWRWLLGGAAGIVVALALALLAGWARRSRRAAARPSGSEALLAKAVLRGDMDGVREAADALAASAGAEVVPALMAALEAPLDDDARRSVAAALYRLGRAVTAEVSPRPRRM